VLSYNQIEGRLLATTDLGWAPHNDIMWYGVFSLSMGAFETAPTAKYVLGVLEGQNAQKHLCNQSATSM